MIWPWHISVGRQNNSKNWPSTIAMTDPWCWYANIKGVYWWDPCYHIWQHHGSYGILKTAVNCIQNSSRFSIFIHLPEEIIDTATTFYSPASTSYLALRQRHAPRDLAQDDLKESSAQKEKGLRLGVRSCWWSAGYSTAGPMRSESMVVTVCTCLFLFNWKFSTIFHIFHLLPPFQSNKNNKTS